MPATVTCTPKGQRSYAEETRLGCSTPKSAVYRRWEPERTLLYRTLQTHLTTWLVLHDDGLLAVFPASSRGRFSAISNAAFLPPALAGHAAPTAATTS